MMKRIWFVALAGAAALAARGTSFHEDMVNLQGSGESYVRRMYPGRPAQVACARTHNGGATGTCDVLVDGRPLALECVGFGDYTSWSCRAIGGRP